MAWGEVNRAVGERRWFHRAAPATRTWVWTARAVGGMIGRVLSQRVRAVLDLVAELNEDERGELRDELDGALCTPAEWGRAWNDELARRVGEVERGDAKLLTEEEFFADDSPSR